MTDHEINKLYQQQSNEQPPVEVDNNILKLAQESILEKPISLVKKSSKKYIPLTMVASFMLVGLVVLNFPDNYINGPESTESHFDESFQKESNLKNTNTIDSRNSSLKSAPAAEEIVPMLDSTQEAFEFIRTPTTISEAQKKQIDEKQQRQRRKVSQQKLNKLVLLKQIADELTIQQPKKAAELAKEYVENFGLEQLPQKYHYLLK